MPCIGRQPALRPTPNSATAELTLLIDDTAIVTMAWERAHPMLIDQRPAAACDEFARSRVSTACLRLALGLHKREHARTDSSACSVTFM
jgi:hypothetical protein